MRTYTEKEIKTWAKEFVSGLSDERPEWFCKTSERNAGEFFTEDFITYLRYKKGCS